MPARETIASLQHALATGQLPRRQFIRRAVAFGLSTSAIGAALVACGTTPASPTTGANSAPTSAAMSVSTAAPTVAPTVVPAATAATRAAAPAGNTPGSSSGTPIAATPTGKRGGGGTLKLLQWQAPVILNYHFGTGGKDNLTSRIFYEPLLIVDGEGALVPILAAGVPTRDNGQIAADGKSLTCALRTDLKWSDGQPVTADDIIFTWQYVTDPKTAAPTIAEYDGVSAIDKLDTLTVRFTFKEAAPALARPTLQPIIPKHIFEKDKGEGARNSSNNLKPVGTGPYKVVDFKPGDAVSMVVNEYYRDPNKPYFDKVELKGGGDAVSAARAVIQSGDYDYAWNLQVEDTILKQLETGGKGVVGFRDGGGVEYITINFTDPNKEIDGERSSLAAPHPFLSDPKVRQALALACDRQTVAASLYGRAGEAATNILYDPLPVRSKNLKAEFNLEKANALLDEAGWARGGNSFRQKGGVAMSLVYVTTVNSARQKTQQIIKDGWGKIGIQVELKSIDASVFFTADPGNPDSYRRFYADIQMSTGGPGFDPQAFMSGFYSKQSAQKANQWSGNNVGRFQSAQYDARWEAARFELDAAKRAQLFIEMNDIAVTDGAIIPLVYRRSAFAYNKVLKGLGTTRGDWDYWNIADWAK